MYISILMMGINKKKMYHQGFPTIFNSTISPYIGINAAQPGLPAFSKSDQVEINVIINDRKNNKGKMLLKSKFIFQKF